MELWMVYALLGVFTSGMYNFTLKVVAERKYNNYLVTFWDYTFGTILLGIYFVYYFYHHPLSWYEFYMTSLFAAINVTFFSLSLFTRVESMRNIDTVLFFPLYKTFGPIMVTLLGFFLFHETLSTRELLGIILGICVPLLLITKTENKIQKNLFLGIILVIATAIFSSISTIGAKGLMVYGFNVELFLFMSFFIGMGTSALSNKIHNYKKNKIYNNTGLISLSFWISLLHISGFIFFTLSMTGNMAVAFTINSFSILIPIVLSIIFYGEHFNLKKAIVIGLSIVSILMFL